MSKFKKNLSWIFIGNIVHAIMSYLINIICARNFGISDYGLINYASSLIALFLAVSTLGFGGIITKMFADDENNNDKYLRTAIISRIIFSLFAIVFLQIIVFAFNKNEPILKLIVFLQSLQILFGSYDVIVYWYRYKYDAKLVAIVRLVSFFVSAVWKIMAVLVFKNISFYVMGVVIETALFSFFLFYFYAKRYKIIKMKFDKFIFKKMIRISYPFIFSALLTTIYSQTDKIMLKSMLGNSSVGLYSVSQTLAGAIAIIPMTLIEGFRPEIMLYKKTNIEKYKKRFKQLYGLVFWICILYCVFITISSKQIIYYMYGEKYLEASKSLALIVWYTSFSYFGAINNLYMVAENKSHYVQIITFVGAGLNIILNLIMIPRFGIVGAAMASLVTQIIANFVLIYIIKPLRENFYYILDGILLKEFLSRKKIINNSFKLKRR